MISKLLIIILFSTVAPWKSWAIESQRLPRLSYLEDRIEKIVDWPMELTVISPENSVNEPMMVLKVRIPPLLHLRGQDSQYQIKKTTGSQILEVNISHPVSVIRLEKVDDTPGSAQPISLRISFPENFGFVKLSQDCLRRYRNPGPLRGQKPVPLITYMYCPNLERIVFKSTPEVEFKNGKKQLHFSSFEHTLSETERKEKIYIKKALVKENVPGEFKITLVSAHDVLERFEQPSVNPSTTQFARGLSEAPPPERFQHFAGFNISQKDPEIYGGFDYKRENWRSYITTYAMITVPAVFRGNSIRHFLDGAVALMANHPLSEPNSFPRGVIGVGAFAAQKSAVEFGSTDAIWGPTAQLSLLRAYQYSNSAYLGLILSGAFPAADPVSGDDFDQIYQLEARWSVVLPHGQLLEPHLKVQHFKFEEKKTLDVTLFKVGMGVRW